MDLVVGVRMLPSCRRWGVSGDRGLAALLVRTSTTSRRLWVFWNMIGQPKAASLMIVIYFLDIHANKRDLYYYGVYVIRPGKWNQLKNAKKKLIAKRGGVNALVATMALLSAQGKATMQQRPNKQANKGKWDDWVEDSFGWMIQREWLTAEEAVGLSGSRHERVHLGASG